MTTDEDIIGDKPYQVFILSLIITIIVGSSVDMFVPSLPYIKNYFHTSTELTRLMVTVYLIVYGLVQPIYGVLVDSFGRRNILILCLFGYTISTLLIPQTSSISHLLIWRGAQGLFCGSIGVIARTLVADTFKGKMLAKFASYVTIAWAVGPILSPYLGGYLQELFNWKVSFYFLAGYSFVSLIAILLFLPETIKTYHRFQVSTIANNLSSVLKHSKFIAGALICGLTYGVITVYNVVGPFLIESVLHYNAVVYGRIALFLGIGWIGGNLATRYFITHPHVRSITIGSILGFLLVSVLLLLFGVFNLFNVWTASIPPIVIFIFAGYLFTLCFARCISIFPEKAGVASAILGSVFSITSGIMSGIGSILKSHTLIPISITYLCMIAVIALVFFTLFQQKHEKIL